MLSQDIGFNILARTLSDGANVLWGGLLEKEMVYMETETAQLPWQMVEREIKRIREVGMLQRVCYVRWLYSAGESRGFTAYQNNKECVGERASSPLTNSVVALPSSEAHGRRCLPNWDEAKWHCLTIRGQVLSDKARRHAGGSAPQKVV